MPQRPALPRFALLAVAVLALNTGCAELLRALRGGVQTPTAKYQSSKLDTISLDDATISASFEITNPNPIAVSVAGVTWAFSLDSQKLFDGSLKGGLQLPASGRTTLVVPVKIPFSAVPGLLTTLANKIEAPYEVIGRVTVTTPLGPIGLPIRWSGLLPIPKMPKVTLNNARVENISFTGARVVLAFDVDNPNVFQLPLQALGGNVSVAGQNIARLSLSAPRPLLAGQKVPLELPVDVSFSSLGLAISSAIASKSATVRLQGEARIAGKPLPLDVGTTLR